MLGDNTKIAEREVKTRASFFKSRSAKLCLAASLTRSANRLTTRADQTRNILSAREIAPGVIKSKALVNRADRHYGDRRHDSDWSRPARLIIATALPARRTIAIDTIISQARLRQSGRGTEDKSYRPLYCIYVAIGQKNSKRRPRARCPGKGGAMPYTTIVSPPASDTATNQYLAPFAGGGHGRVVHG